MAFTSNHVTGFLFGLGAASVGFVLYKKNQEKVDDFLRSKGIAVSSGGSRDAASMTLEELVSEKEKLEDLIAEKEYTASQKETEAKAPAKAK